ncbi:Ubiquitin C [Aphelenchoides besseyi]|nr:Ubiquitin C [Aphelenchoides besseyi]
MPRFLETGTVDRARRENLDLESITLEIELSDTIEVEVSIQIIISLARKRVDDSGTLSGQNIERIRFPFDRACWMKIVVETTTQMQFTLEIQAKEGILIEDQLLLLNNSRLHDHLTLSDCGSEKEAFPRLTLHIYEAGELNEHMT